MVRAFIILLLMAIFFLSGAVYGMKESGHQMVQEDTVEQSAEVPMEIPSNNIDGKEENNIVNIPDEYDDNNVEDMVELPTSSNLTQKTASVLEIGVQGFYEAVVNLLYGVATLFF